MDEEKVPFYRKKLGCVSSFLVVLGIFFVLMIIGMLVGDDVGNTNTNSRTSVFDDTDNTGDTETQVKTQKEYQLLTTFTGEGDKNTESFSITSDKVKLVATKNKKGTNLFIDLVPDDDSYLSTSGIDMSYLNEETTSETIYRNLETGSYYLEVNAGASWKVEVYQEVEVPISE